MRDSIMLSFSLSEYEQRIKKLVSLMHRENMDAVILTSDNNCFYFSGYQCIVWESKVSTPAVVVITSDGSVSLTTSKGGIEGAKATSWVEDIRYFGGDGYKNVSESSVSLLKEKKLINNGRIGLELGIGHKIHFNYSNQQQLFEELKNVVIMDAGPILWELRSIKSTLEVERLRKASQINSIAIKNCFQTARVGMTEHELYRKLAMEYYRLGAEKLFTLGLRAGKERYSQGNCPPGPHKIAEGEIILVDGGPAYDGYFSDIIRQAVIGKPTQHQLDLFNVARDACYVGIDKIKPGRPIYEVKNAIDDFICNSRFAYLHKNYTIYGHSIGLNVHEYPMLDNSKQLLEPGMVFAIEPEIFEAEVGSMGIEENLVITETGCEILSSTDSNLMMISHTDCNLETG